MFIFLNLAAYTFFTTMRKRFNICSLCFVFLFPFFLLYVYVILRDVIDFDYYHLHGLEPAQAAHLAHCREVLAKMVGVSGKLRDRKSVV